MSIPFRAKKPFNKKFGGGGGSRGGSRDFEKPMLYKATCAQCNQSCEVPFRPNGRKPVLCSTCFKQDGGGSFDSGRKPWEKSYDKPMSFDRNERSSDRNERSSGSNSTQDQLNAMNTKLDTILKLLRQMEE